MASQRPSVDETHMEVAYVWSKRSTCLRGQVGAVLVIDGRAIASGYNGSPPGVKHCTEVGCDVPTEWAGCQRILHAEANVIAFAARHGVRTEGATLYCTHGPCPKCAQLILSAGIKRVVYGLPYRLLDGMTLLIEQGVAVERMTAAFMKNLNDKHEDKWID